MLEIILLIFLTKKIGNIATEKGLKPIGWKVRLILFWILGELIGVVIGVVIFGPENLISCMLIAIAFAATSYFLIKNYLLKLPDAFNEDDINNIGQ